jgi:GNAT superfamily N-acetyltransferase
MTLIRRARIADAGGIARVYLESWRTSYAGLIPEPYLLGLSLPVLTERWRTQFATADPETAAYVAVARPHGVVGFASGGPQRGGLPGYGGEVYTLYLQDFAQGHGLGRRMMAAMAGTLLERGHRSALVWVLRDNPARWFYERLGGQRLAEQTICLAKVLLPEVAYGWHDLTTLARLPVNPPLE